MIQDRMEEPRLDLIQFDLTDQCPLFCSHCSNSSGPQLRLALGHHFVEMALADAVDLGCRNVTFSGGEPLCYVHLAAILVECQKRRVATTLFTTGIRDKGTRLSLGDSEWAELRALGLGTAIFSVYSSANNRKFHNEVVRLHPTREQDAFRVNELAILRACSAGIRAEVQFIPSSATCSDLPAIASWATELGISKVHLQFPSFQGRNAANPSLHVNDSQEAILKAYSLSLSQQLGAKFHISRLWCARWKIPTDAQLLSQVIVRSDGVVVRCNACKYLHCIDQRSIYEESLQQIWRNENWRNAPCECSKQSIGKTAVGSGRSGMHIVPAYDVLASGIR